MKSNYAYYIPDYGGTAESATPFESVWEDVEGLAEDAAELDYNDGDGHDVDPRTVVILTDGQELGRCRVTIEFDPRFTAEEIREKP